MLVNKYVEMVYANKIGGEAPLSFEEFGDFVNQHPNLFRILYKCFNHDVWGFDHDTNKPRVLALDKDFEGTLLKLNRKTHQLSERQCQLVLHFLLEFKGKKPKLPNSKCPTRLHACRNHLPGRAARTGSVQLDVEAAGLRDLPQGPHLQVEDLLLPE